MRTGSPIGGGPSVRGSPASKFDCSGEPMVSKPPKDVEAAIIMTRLGGAIAECEMRGGLLDGDRESTRGDGLMRFTHIKSAVMPERHSYVQRALKRKIENRMELSAQGVDCLTDANQEVLLKKAIESERCNFDRVKRCRMTEYEAANASDADVCGRFIRTGQACRQSEDERYPKVSYLEIMSPYVGKREMVIPSPDGSSFDKCSSDDGNVTRYHQMRGESGLKYHRYSPKMHGHSEMPTLSPLLKSGKILGSSYRTEKLPNWSVAVSNTNEQLTSSRLDARRNIPSQHDFHSYTSKTELSSRQQVQLNRGEVDKHVSKTNSLSAFYSLGRHVASTLNTPPSLPVLSGPRIVNAPPCSQRIESRQQYPSVKRESLNKLYGTLRSGGVMNENKKVRVLDSRTEKKVKTGEFGTLHSLQDFYKNLCSRRSQVPPKQVFRDRLGSITNCWPDQVHRNSKNVDEKFNKNMYCSRNRIASQETAIDLSLHNRRTCSDICDEKFLDVDSRYELEVANKLRRKSRSCCSSPNVCLDLAVKPSVKQFSSVLDEKPVIDSGKPMTVLNRYACTTPSSLPSSPFPTLNATNVKQEIFSSPVEELPLEKQLEADKSAKELLISVVKADSCLPLKKRRLLDVSNDMVEVKSPRSSTDTSSADLSPLDQLKSPSLTSAVVNCDEDGDLPLHIAIAEGNCDIVERILDIMARLGMSLDRYNNYKQTPLHVAVITDQPAVVKRLLEGGSSPNIVDLDGFTSVHHAASLKSSSCLDCLLNHSKFPLKLDALTYDGLTALHLAVQQCNLQAVMSLINAGARVDACDGTNGRTPLSYAVQQNDRQTTRILLAGGANSSMLTYSELSPAHRAVAPHCRTSMARQLDAYVTADVKG